MAIPISDVTALQAALDAKVPQFKTVTATATAKDVVYMTAAGTAARARANALATMYAIGFATETKTAAACIIQTGGSITITGATFTPGLPVYISKDIAGLLTQDLSGYTVGHFVQMVGTALTATDIEIQWGDVITVGAAVLGLANGGTNSTDYRTAVETFTNKRITPRVQVLPYNDATQTVGETAGYDTNLADMFICGTPTSSHGIAAGMDFGAPGGTPVEGQKLIFRLYFATAQTITWNSVFASRGVTLPGAASGGTAKYVTVGFLYNSLAAKWDCVAVATEA